MVYLAAIRVPFVVLLALASCGGGGNYAEKKAREWAGEQGAKGINDVRCGEDPLRFVPEGERKKEKLPEIPPGYVFCSLLVEGDLVTLLECPASRDAGQYRDRGCHPAGLTLRKAKTAGATENIKRIYEGARTYYQEEARRDEAASLTWLSDDALAREQATKTHRRLLVFVCAEWAVPCAAWRKVFQDASVARLLHERYLLVHIDVTDQGDAVRAAQARWKADVLPAVILAASNGDEARRFSEPVPSPAQFFEMAGVVP